LAFLGLNDSLKMAQAGLKIILNRLKITYRITLLQVSAEPPATWLLHYKFLWNLHY